MRKGIITVFALFFVLPAVCFAGSVTSRWDMTVGGYVKFDMGWASQGASQDIATAQRSGGGGYDSLADEYGNYFSYAGETRLNFLVRGPDAWGAKTKAFVEGHFRGTEANGSTTTGNGGTFVLRHAFMQLDWPDAQLVIGQTWNKFANLPTHAYTLLDFSGLATFMKGVRQPQVRFEHRFARQWSYSIAAISPTNTLGSNANNGVDSYSRSGMPLFEGSLGFQSDKCGNIGPWKLLFNLDGFYARQKQTIGLTTPSSLTYSSKDVDSWGVAFRGFVPIIPEKKGHKAGAFSFSGVLFYSQNPGMLNNPRSATGATSSYARLSTGDVSFPSTIDASLGVPDYAAPVTWGGWGQLSYFITDRLSANGWYGYLRNNLSTIFQNTPSQANQTQNNTNIIVNLVYDLNAAIRFGAEYGYFNTRYAGYPTVVNGIPTSQKDGTLHVFRLGAYYFF